MITCCHINSIISLDWLQLCGFLDHHFHNILYFFIFSCKLQNELCQYLPEIKYLTLVWYFVNKVFESNKYRTLGSLEISWNLVGKIFEISVFSPSLYCRWESVWSSNQFYSGLTITNPIHKGYRKTEEIHRYLNDGNKAMCRDLAVITIIN